VVVAAADDQLAFGPNDLRAHGKAANLKAGLNHPCMDAAVPDVGNIAGEAMDFMTAAAFPVAYGTAHFALTHRGHLQSGETLLVLGAAGRVGLTAVEIGKALGARVIAAAGGADKGQKPPSPHAGSNRRGEPKAVLQVCSAIAHRDTNRPYPASSLATAEFGQAVTSLKPAHACCLVYQAKEPTQGDRRAPASLHGHARAARHSELPTAQ